MAGCPKGYQPLSWCSRWLRGSEWREAVEGAVCSLPPTPPSPQPAGGRTGTPSPRAPGQVALPTNRPPCWRGPQGGDRGEGDTCLLKQSCHPDHGPSLHGGETESASPGAPVRLGLGLGLGPGGAVAVIPLLYFEVVPPWLLQASRSLLPHTRPLPPTDILPRCSCQGWEPVWPTQKAEGLEGPGGEVRRVWGPPTAASKLEPGPSPLCTGSPRGGPSVCRGREPVGWRSVWASDPALPARGLGPPWPPHQERGPLLIACPTRALHTALKAQIILTTVPHLSPVLFGKQPLSCCTKRFLWLSSSAGR